MLHRPGPEVEYLRHAALNLCHGINSWFKLRWDGIFGQCMGTMATQNH